MENLCPLCGGRAVLSCKCPRQDSKCANGHWWHYCIAEEHREPVKLIGQITHAQPTFACCCPAKPIQSWRIVRRRVILAGEIIQPCVFKHGHWIPLGPFCDSLDEVREYARALLAACEQPILEEREVEIA